MTDPRDRDSRTLDAALEALPREVQLGRDLWPGVAARLEPRAGIRAGHRLWPAAAAAVALVAVTALVTAGLLRREETPVARQAPAVPAVIHAAATFGPGQVLDPSYDAARQELARALSARIDRLPPEARRQLERNLAELRRASAEINAALELSPGDPLLEELLLNSYQDELAVLASVNQLAGANGAGPAQDPTRMKL